jgi:hypothetical protein
MCILHQWHDCSDCSLPDFVVVLLQIANEDAASPGEGTGRDPIWDSILPQAPPAASLTALPGMFCNEQYTVEQKRALVIFRYLLVFVAALESFAHGANDTANATGALSHANAPCIGWSWPTPMCKTVHSLHEMATWAQ